MLIVTPSSPGGDWTKQRRPAATNARPPCPPLRKRQHQYFALCADRQLADLTLGRIEKREDATVRGDSQNQSPGVGSDDDIARAVDNKRCYIRLRCIRQGCAAAVRVDAKDNSLVTGANEQSPLPVKRQRPDILGLGSKKTVVSPAGVTR